MCRLPSGRTSAFRTFIHFSNCFIFSCRSVGCGRKNFPIHQRSYSNTPAAHRRGHANLQAQNVSTDVSEHAPDLWSFRSSLTNTAHCPFPRRDEDSYQKFIPFIGVRILLLIGNFLPLLLLIFRIFGWHPFLFSRWWRLVWSSLVSLQQVSVWKTSKDVKKEFDLGFHAISIWVMKEMQRRV